MKAKLIDGITIASNSSFSKAYCEIIKMEQYTSLNRPVINTSERIRLIQKEIQRKIKNRRFEFPDDYVSLHLCFDGGLLFGTLIYSISQLHGDSNDYELLSINNKLHEDKDIPEEFIVIAMMDYGHFIAYQIADQAHNIYVWDPDNKCIVGSWSNIGEWLEEECIVAKRLLAEKLLTPCED